MHCGRQYIIWWQQFGLSLGNVTLMCAMSPCDYVYICNKGIQILVEHLH